MNICPACKGTGVGVSEVIQDSDGQCVERTEPCVECAGYGILDIGGDVIMGKHVHRLLRSGAVLDDLKVEDFERRAATVQRWIDDANDPNLDYHPLSREEDCEIKRSRRVGYLLIADLLEAYTEMQHRYAALQSEYDALAAEHRTCPRRIR